jgi:hypothetical protein
MESWSAMMRRKERQARRKEIVNTIKEFVGAIIFFTMLFGICALCTICSGYHWE